MPAEPAVLRWTGAALEPAGPISGAVLAADSWLVDEGRTLALAAHRERFLATVDAQSTVALDASPAAAVRADAERCWDAALAALPRSGAWFPRIELLRTVEGSELRLQLRSAPPRQRKVVLATHRGADPRRSPRIKGPDLEALGAVRQDAAERGAGEGVLLSPDGELVEGGYSALAWWRDGALHVVDDALPRIASVTEAALLELAAEHEIRIVPSVERPQQLESCELWVLSALHGPRLATAWVDGPALAAESGRLGLWRARLEARRAPLG